MLIMTDERRYWARVGMYVTREFADQWIEKLNSEGATTGGKYLDDDVEEYVAPAMVTTSSLKAEVNELFSQPYEEVELPPETRAILKVAEMEAGKIARIKELKAEGYALEEAKSMVTKEINLAVAEIMGIDLDEFEAREEARIAEARQGAEAQEASVDDGEE